ncbi:MAG TPA: rhodanese-like domain-containing protein [Acidimicrobiales bacterium]|nr:rhodanese-like domain-containing protein [Acidimicrobiales bacterium]
MSFHQPPQVPEVGLDELADSLEDGAVLIDVRMPDEYEEMHVPGAVLLPLPDLPHRAREVPRGQRVYVICATGARSVAAVQALNNAGWDTVSVAGGTKGWAAEGRPVQGGARRS